MNVGVRNLQAQYSHSNSFTVHGLIDGKGYLFCKDHHIPKQFIIQVKQVIGLCLGYDQCMPLCQRIDVKKSIVTFIFMDLVRGDLPCYDS